MEICILCSKNYSKFKVVDGFYSVTVIVPFLFSQRRFVKIYDFKGRISTFYSATVIFIIIILSTKIIRENSQFQGPK